MGKSQYRRQHYITYDGYIYTYLASPDSSSSLGLLFISSAGKKSGGQSSQRVKTGADPGNFAPKSL